MRRLATLFLMVGPVLLIGLLPLRPLILAIWPAPVEEIVRLDGRWSLVPVLPRSLAVDDGDIRARTRPMSLVEVQLRNGDRVHGYLLDRIDSADTGAALLLATGPKSRKLLPVAEQLFVFYPNDLSWSDRFRLAMTRLRHRQPVS